MGAALHQAVRQDEDQQIAVGVLREGVLEDADGFVVGSRREIPNRYAEAIAGVCR